MTRELRRLQRHLRRRHLAQSGRGGDRIGDNVGCRTASRPKPRHVGPSRPAAPGRPAPPAASGPSLARVSAGCGAIAGAGAGSGCDRQATVFDRRVSQATQRSGASNVAFESQRHDRRTRLHRPVQHRSRTHRRQQQHRRLGGQRRQFGQAARPRRLGRQQDQRRLTGQQHGRASAQVRRSTVHGPQTQHLLDRGRGSRSRARSSSRI